MDYVVREITVKYKTRKKVDKLTKIKQPADIAIFMQTIIKDEPKEHFYSIFLNAQYEIVAYQLIAIGTASRAIVAPKEVFQAAFKINAEAICFCHNHPSGNLEPSDCDIKTTKRLCEAGEILGVKVLDHTIISNTNFYSFAEHDLIHYF